MIVRHTFATLGASPQDVIGAAYAPALHTDTCVMSTPALKTAQPDAALYPWQLDPKLAAAIWGGGELVQDYSKHGDPQAKIGESWECWDADAVTNGSLKGSTIAMLRERLGTEFLGELDANANFSGSYQDHYGARLALGAGAPTMRMPNASSINASGRPNVGM